jgi:hypothetical protein
MPYFSNGSKGKCLLRVYLENVFHFESEDRLGKIHVLRHVVRHL